MFMFSIQNKKKTSASIMPGIFVRRFSFQRNPLDIYPRNRYNENVIKSFADRETERVYQQQFSRKLPASIQRVALRKLMMIDNAENLNDLRVPPANFLEKLHRDREGQHSIRVNDQYRICFTEKDGDYYNVEIVDYH